MSVIYQRTLASLALNLYISRNISCSIYFTVYTLPMKEAKLFTNGQSQAVRLPKEFRFSGKSVYIKRSGAYVILIPKEKPWRTMFAARGKFTSDFMPQRDQGNQENREDISL